MFFLAGIGKFLRALSHHCLKIGVKYYEEPIDHLRVNFNFSRMHMNEMLIASGKRRAFM